VRIMQQAVCEKRDRNVWWQRKRDVPLSCLQRHFFSF
jgi:hypothetical protein